jgi:hypothetical protein
VSNNWISFEFNHFQEGASQGGTREISIDCESEIATGVDVASIMQDTLLL